MKLILRLRKEVEESLVTVWLIHRTGQIEEQLLYGIMSIKNATDLVEAFQGACTIEQSEFKGSRLDEPRPSTVKMKQDNLFSKEPQ